MKLNSNERGAALLFAMGLLSLFLLLAMAFAASSLMQRKIAANRGTRAMYEVLADSALNRVLLTLKLYNSDQWDNSVASDDITALRTTWQTGGGVSIQDGIAAAFEVRSRFSGKNLYDKDYFEDSPLHITSAKKWLEPNWHLVSSNDPEPRLTGRYAYAVLPDFPRRFFDQIYFSFEDYILQEKITDPDEKDEKLVQWELYRPSQPEAYVATANAVPQPEDFFQRFNLSRSDWGTLTVAKLLGETGKPEGFIAFASDGKMEFKYNRPLPQEEAKTPVVTDVIQFLRRVGDQGETFGNTATGLLQRRRQIAANLIDYCDGDLEPTSNVALNEWMTTDPEYTGNERTLYLDRLGVVIQPNLSLGLADNTAILKLLPGSIDLALVAGLVDVYGCATAVPNYQVRVKSGADRIQISGDVTGALQYSYTYTDETVTPAEDRTVPSTGGLIYDLPTGLTWSYTSDAIDETLAMPGVQAFVENGYVVGAKKTVWSATAPPPIDLAFGDVFVASLDPDGELAKLIADTEPGKKLKAITWVDKSVTVNVKEVVVSLDRMQLSVEETSAYHPADLALFAEKISYPMDVIACTLSGSGSAASGNVIVTGGVWAKDPRQNLFKEDWYLGKGESGANLSCLASDSAAMQNVLGATTLPSTIFTDSAAQPLTALQLPSLTVFKDRNPQNGADLETVSTPAWVNDTQHLSTGFFRNGPMKSLAELGFIHRGAMWETLNLHNAARPQGITDVTKLVGPVTAADYVFPGNALDAVGSSYIEGDGGLLDQTKVDVLVSKTPNAFASRAYRDDLYNLNMRDGAGTYVDSNGGKYFEALLGGITLGAFQKTASLDVFGGTDLLDPGFEVVWQALDAKLNFRFVPPATGMPLYASRAQLLFAHSGTTDDRFYNAYGVLTATNAAGYAVNKALYDELCAKTMEWSYVNALPIPDVYRVLIVAQSIQDIGGNDVTFSVSKDLDGDGKIDPATEKADVQQGVYEPGFDEITGQTRMLVTIVRDPLLGKFTVRDIEYIAD